MGRLIPAGTGLTEYNRKEIRVDAPPVEEVEPGAELVAEAAIPAGD